MKKLSLILPLLAVALASLLAAADKQKLPETYRKWIDDDVSVIATSVERDVFLKLQTDRERDLFIEAFWKQRDPTPDSPENEYKTEYYRRLEYVDRYFGRDAPRPGRKTDRGRIYLILGEPREIQRFEAEATIYDAEVWFYQGKSDMGLPAGFNVVFFRRGGHGEYKLYSPVADGPQALRSGAPAETKEFVLICDDPDAPTPEPWVHWVIYKIPGNATGLPEGLPRKARLKPPEKILQGANSWSTPGKPSVGYQGPHPPAGHGDHHYHFVVYALDASPVLEPSLSKKQLLAEITEHVVATGELIGIYSR